MAVLINLFQKDGSVMVNNEQSEESVIDDIKKLGIGTGTTGGITIIDNANSVFIPDDLVDRVALCDLLTRVADLIDKVNLAIPTMVSDPSVTSEIVTLKNDILTTKQDLK